MRDLFNMIKKTNSQNELEIPDVSEELVDPTSTSLQNISDVSNIGSPSPIEQQDLTLPEPQFNLPEDSIPQLENAKPLSKEEALLEEFKKIRQSSDDELKTAKTMDAAAFLGNVISNQLSNRRRARAIRDAQSINADPGAIPTVQLPTSSAKNVLAERSAKINDLLTQQKILGLTGKAGKSLDPSSQASARARQTLKTMGIEVPDTMTEDEASRFGQVLLANRGKEERQKSTLELAKERLGTSQTQFSKRMDEKEQDDLIKAVDKFNSDKVVQKANEMSAGASTVLDLVRSENPLGHAAVPTFLARASGEVGALTEADKAPFGGSRSLSSRISQSVEQYKTGKITKENLQFIERLADTMQKNALKNKNARAVDLSKQKVNKKFTQNELYKSFTGEELIPAKTTPVKNTVKEIERRTSDGKIAIFDADTKKFIRYKD
jgi:hypothetical protein